MTGTASAASQPLTGAVDDASASTVVKQLTLNQLKDVIDAIYASKEKFDRKCFDAKLPRETVCGCTFL